MIWLLFLPLLILVPYLGDFLFSPGSVFSDLLISHFPNAFFAQQALLQWGEIPLWSPTILSGYPFAADPLAGLWYPPGWIGVWLPAPLGFNLAYMLHLIWGGIGMYVWLRREGLGQGAAITGALLFEGMPKIWGHFAAGHVSLVYAVAWTPWLLYTDQGAAHNKASMLQKCLPGAVLAAIILADPRWAPYAFLLWIGYSLHKRQVRISWSMGESWKDRITGISAWALRNLSRILVTSLLAILLSAVAVLPLFEYSRLSTRSLMRPEDTMILSLPAERLLNLIIPNPGGQIEWVVYPSAVGLVFLVVSFVSVRLRSRTGFWLWVAILSLLYSLGSAIPLLPELAQLPGFNLLRVPPRALFLFGMSASAAAAYGVDAFLNNPAGEMAIGRARPKLILAGLIGIEVFLAAGIWVITRQLLPEILLGAGWVTLTAVLVLLRLSNRIKADWFMAGILAAAIFGPAINNRMGFQPRAAEDIFGEANLAAAYLKVQPGQFRVYSPSYSIPQHTAVFYGLELADGVDPLQLRSYVDFMERATGVPAKGYSVTIPPFSTGDPRIDNQNYLPDPRLLGWLNVRFVVSGFELDHQALTLRARIGDLWIYENTRAFPRAWLEDVDEAQGIRQVKVKDWSPNRILLEAEGSGRVVVSEIYYPGWEVEVDGVPKTIEPYAGILRSVEVREGEHQITFTFRPRTVNLGLWLAAASWGMLVVLFIFRKKAAPN